MTERPPGPVETAALSDNREAVLRALRDRLAREIDECRSLRDLSPTAKRLVDTVDQLDALIRAAASTDDEPTMTPLDEIHARRRARGAYVAERNL